MTSNISKLDRMTSHVGRDLLNEAKAFSNEGKAVGEYVKNSWQYTSDHPTVEVLINQEEKSIMNKKDLDFFCTQNP